MARWLAGTAAILFLVIGTVFALQSHAEEPTIPHAPEPRLAAGTLSPIPNAPEAEPQSKEAKRFARADKNKDGRISMAEMVEPRRKAFAKLDLNSDGQLSFEEWAIRTINKFETADTDHSKWLTAAEYAATAPKPPKKKPVCSC